jgi:hypothetical protein
VYVIVAVDDTEPLCADAIPTPGVPNDMSAELELDHVPPAGLLLYVASEKLQKASGPIIGLGN